MSDTPRTDAAEVEFQRWNEYAKQYGHLPEAMEQAPVEADPFDIARQLERELATANHWLEQVRGSYVELLAAQSAIPNTATCGYCGEIRIVPVDRTSDQ